MGHTTNMGDCATDLAKTIMPLATAGGIYDWSGTQASHVYAEEKVNVTKPEIDAMVKGWWDGHPMAGVPRRTTWLWQRITSHQSAGKSMFVSDVNHLVMAIACTSSVARRRRRVTRPWHATHTQTTHFVSLSQMKMKERPKDLPWLPCNP